MRVAILGGTFNPPHCAHVDMGRYALEHLGFDRLLVIPTSNPPHKEVAGDVSELQRLELTRIAFQSVSNAHVSDIEVRRGGRSYTYDTVLALKEQNPTQQHTLVVGQDMLESIESWFRFEALLETIPIVVFPRKTESKELKPLVDRLSQTYQCSISTAGVTVGDLSSTVLRQCLQSEIPQGIPAQVLRRIVQDGIYGVKLGEERMETERERASYRLLEARLNPHRLWHSIAVMDEMGRLAIRYGVDRESARIAGLIHDITKDETTENQLRLCSVSGILISELEKSSPKLLHAITGAVVADDVLVESDQEILNAIRYHTTGRADMTLLEKMLYIADYVEPLRDFEGIDAVRSMYVEDLDGALLRALDSTITEVLNSGGLLHPDTVHARNYLVAQRSEACEIFQGDCD